MIIMTVIFLKSYTSRYSRRAVIIALQTSAITLKMDALDILNKYIKLPSESPVARYLKITANLSLAGIACRKEVFFREITGDTIFSNSSKSVGVMRMIFLKPRLFSMRNLLKIQLYFPCNFLSIENFHTHHPCLMHLSLLFITVKEALHVISRTALPP
jgi:hypothetical protein